MATGNAIRQTKGDSTLLSFDDIAAKLAACQPLLITNKWLTPAAVALILRAGPSGLEMLFIERARHDDDPWSGNLGFPGGKVEEHDAGERQTAERETREEIGLDLASARCLGRLSDIAGSHMPVRVSCYVYGLPAAPTVVTPGEEVRAIYWVPLTDLLVQERHISAPVRFSGDMLTAPAIRIFEPGNTPLWGLTYRMVMQFLQVLDFLPLSATSSPAVPSGVR